MHQVTKNQMFVRKNGFTLIELLAVVLIIGILAAVALPQYNKAVNKSRISQLWTTLNAIEKAGQLAVLAGKTDTALYGSNLSADIEIPNLQLTSLCSATGIPVYRTDTKTSVVALSDGSCEGIAQDVDIYLRNGNMYCWSSKTAPNICTTLNIPNGPNPFM